MRVNPVTNNQINFKSVMIYSIDKKEFKHPEDLVSVYDSFNDWLEENPEMAPPTKIKKILCKFRSAREKIAPCYFLEQPLYVPIIEKLNEKGLSLDWLSNHSGIKIDPPLDPNSHSFIVLTDESKRNFLHCKDKIFSELFPKMEKADIASGLNPDYALLRIMAQMNKLLIDVIKPLFPDVFKNVCK